MSRICVKNLGKNTTEKQLKDLFGTKGEVTDVRIVKTKSGKSRQLAFLGFRTDVQAQESISYFNNTFLETARIVVELAKKIGDQTLIETTRSKITKKKLEKASKETAVEAQKIKNDLRLAKKVSIKEASLKEQSKEKRDFMEAMKPRRNTQFWANDESLPAEISAVDEDDHNIPSENYPREEEDDSDVDDEDVNDFTNKIMTIEKKSDSSKKNTEDSGSGDSERVDEAVVSPKKALSDMDFLRSKVKVNFSDDEDSDSEKMKTKNGLGNSESDSDEESIQPVKSKRSSSSAAPALVITEPSSSEMDVEHSSGTASGNIPGSSNDIIAGDDNDEYEDSGRLFVRNLTFSCTEDELKNIFSVFGAVTTVHLPLDNEKKSKGYGFIQFIIPEQAQKAREKLDGSSFQGRLLHIINAKKAPEIIPKDLDKGKVKLSSFQQKKEEERRKMANKTEGWNASFVRSDAVVDSLAER